MLSTVPNVMSESCLHPRQTWWIVWGRVSWPDSVFLKPLSHSPSLPGSLYSLDQYKWGVARSPKVPDSRYRIFIWPNVIFSFITGGYCINLLHNSPQRAIQRLVFWHLLLVLLGYCLVATALIESSWGAIVEDLGGDNLRHPWQGTSQWNSIVERKRTWPLATLTPFHSNLVPAGPLLPASFSSLY